MWSAAQVLEDKGREGRDRTGSRISALRSDWTMFGTNYYIFYFEMVWFVWHSEGNMAAIFGDSGSFPFPKKDNKICSYSRPGIPGCGDQAEIKERYVR